MDELLMALFKTINKMQLISFACGDHLATKGNSRVRLGTKKCITRKIYQENA